MREIEYVREQLLAGGLRDEELSDAARAVGKWLSLVSEVRPGNNELLSAVSCWRVALELNREGEADAIKSVIRRNDSLLIADISTAHTNRLLASGVLVARGKD